MFCNCGIFITDFNKGKPFCHYPVKYPGTIHNAYNLTKNVPKYIPVILHDDSCEQAKMLII